MAAHSVATSNPLTRHIYSAITRNFFKGRGPKPAPRAGHLTKLASAFISSGGATGPPSTLARSVVLNSLAYVSAGSVFFAAPCLRASLARQSQNRLKSPSQADRMASVAAGTSVHFVDLVRPR